MILERTIICVLPRYLCYSISNLVSHIGHLLTCQTLQQPLSYEILLILTKTKEELFRVCGIWILAILGRNSSEKDGCK
jgi:hypothetical protein